MAANSPELSLIVSPYPKFPFGYRWEIRRLVYGASLERAGRSYRTEQEAGAAGLSALDAIRMARALEK